MNRHGVMLTAGFAVWASAFVLLYAMLSVGCRFGWHEMAFAGTSLQRVQLAVILLVHVAAGAAIVWMLGGQGNRADGTAIFMRRAGYAAALAALASTLFSFGGVFFLSTCH
ncbi:hypothetical protein [Mesorhizobium sp. CAU 1741]|uniref:hypothetical protein n=1 Tax=Mesorhizobium sp. CAU 1741 TaxID=3140366 RepID=UPI00325AC80B